MKHLLLFLLIVSLASVTFAQTNSPSFIAPEREWRDGKGNVVNATWKSISRNGAIIWLQSTIDKKPLKVNVRNLSTNDQAFVNAYLSNCRRQHLVWDGGVFISQDEHLKRLEQKVVELEKQRELKKRLDAALDKNKAYNDRMAAAHKSAMERKLAHVRANPSIYSPAERRLEKDRTQNTEDSADMRYPSMIAAQSPRRKKWNVSKEDWLMLQEANRNFPHDREEYLRQHPYDPHFEHYEPPKIFFGEDGHLRYDSNYQ